MKKYLKPLGNRVIIKKAWVDPSRMTRGGIVIPETHGDDSPLVSGTVMEVGRGFLKEFIKGEKIMVPVFDVPEVKVGDTVLFDRHAGVIITNEDDEEIQIVRETDIYAVERSK